ncbi:cytidylyltransferase domain-containing protein [Streptomyces kaempferi]
MRPNVSTAPSWRPTTNASKRRAASWASSASVPESTSPAPIGSRRSPSACSAEAYINVQGDEPFISPTAIDAISEALEYLPPGALAVNAYTELAEVGAVLDHNVVKVVVSAQGEALMFSRQPIPYPKGERPKYLRQLGLYGFTGPALQRFRQLQQGPLERAEGVEMLRFVEHGHAVQMITVEDDGVAVDTPEDLARAESLLTQYAQLTAGTTGRPVGP